MSVYVEEGKWGVRRTTRPIFRTPCKVTAQVVIAQILVGAAKTIELALPLKVVFEVFHVLALLIEDATSTRAIRVHPIVVGHASRYVTHVAVLGGHGIPLRARLHSRAQRRVLSLF